MAEFILIYGKSGSGKTRSLCNFREDEIFYVNVTGKRPPFRKKFKYEFKSTDVEMIKRGLSKMPCKTAVIDDPTQIPIGYQKIMTEPIKSLIAKAIKSGVAVPGAHLEDSHSVIVR